MAIRRQGAGILVCGVVLMLTMALSGCGRGNNPSDDTSTYPTFPVNPVTSSNREKIAQINENTRPYRYTFDNPVSLYVATAPGQPADLPSQTDAAPAIELVDSAFIDPAPVYSNAYRGAFVEQGKDETLWFATEVAEDAAAKVVWQIASRPFQADAADWKNPEGLIDSGEAATGETEFAVDFSALDLTKFPTESRRIDGSPPPSRLYAKQQSYWVRALAVDEGDNIVGEMDRGFEVLHGSRISTAPSITDLEILFYLKTPAMPGDPYGEISSPFDNYLIHAVYPPMTVDWYFKPENFPQDTDTLYLQVSRSPLGIDPDDWRDPPGLVYELELTKGMALFDGLGSATGSIPIDFGLFAAEQTEYYVRAVALSPGAETGTVAASYSTTVRFVCRAEGDSEMAYYPPPEPTVLEAPMPSVRLVKYEPVAWEEPDWMYWYEVTRQPSWREYTNGAIINDSPVASLPVGQTFKLAPPAQEDGSWLKQAWDAVSDFFSSIFEYAAKVTDWVASAYNNAKARLVSYATGFIADNLPLLPQNLRDDLQSALEFTIDGGLAAIGIPPELPSFDDLSEQGLDYLAANALDMAGIPETDLTKDMVRDLAGGIEQGLHDAATTGDAPNPLDWNFVRQSPGALYRPAYLLVEVSNPYDFATPSGTLRGKVFHTLTADERTVPEIQSLSAAFNGSSYFELYRPVDDVRIPRLLPHQTIQVPVYLYEYTGAKYPWSPHTVTQNEFLHMYNFIENFTFSFRIDFDLPPAAQYAAEHAVPANEAGYVYAALSRGVNFTGSPAYTYAP